MSAYLLEQVADSRCSNTNKHLNKLGTRDAEEGYTSLASNGLGQEGLSCSWGTHQQHSLGNAGSYCCESFGPLEELNYLCNTTC